MSGKSELDEVNTQEYEPVDSTNGLASFDEDNDFEQSFSDEELFAEFQATPSSEQQFIDEMNNDTFVTHEAFEIEEGGSSDEKVFQSAVEAFGEEDLNNEFSTEESTIRAAIEPNMDYEKNKKSGGKTQNKQVNEPEESQNHEFQKAPEAPQNDPELHDDELDPDDMPQKKKPILLYVVVFLVVGTILGGVAFGFKLVLDSANSTPKSVTTTSQPVPSSRDQAPKEQTPAIETNFSTSSDDITDEVFNGIAGLESGSGTSQSDALLIADQDPAVRKLFDEQQQKINELQSQISQENTKKNDLANLATEAESERDNALRQLQTVQKDLEQLKREKSINDADYQKVINGLKEEITNVEGELAKSKNIIDKQNIQLQESKTRASLQASRDSKVIAELAQNVKSLTEQITKLNTPKKSAPRNRKPLAELRFIGANYAENSMIFEVYRSGVKDNKPIQLSKGEQLNGRGVIANIDDYGCISFTTGKQYQPMNAKCR
ncbi:TPA: hypothetical protein ACN33X_001439 [Vibrio parahaemolyticus]